MKNLVLIVIVSSLAFASCETEENKDLNTTIEVKLASEIKWEKLNPARGDQSPKAGTIWGDRKGTEPTGFLAEFKDGFSSPPHIHNVTYRAMVLSGFVHNDDPKAENMWMPAGSFWTQPAGESHITVAKGTKNIAYVEIDKGPYLVKPIEEATDNGERPVNIDKSNIVWLDGSQSEYVAGTAASVAFLWENDGLSGNLIKLPANFKGELVSEGSIFHAVIIEGNTAYTLENETKTLDPGSYFTSQGKAIHSVSTLNSEENTIYIRTNGSLKLIEL